MPKQAQPPVLSGHQCVLSCYPLGLVLRVKDPSYNIGALLPNDHSPTSTFTVIKPPAQVTFLNARFDKTTNKSQKLKLLPVSILCGPDTELGAGPPSLQPPGYSTGSRLAWGFGTSSAPRIPTPLTPGLVSFVLPVISAFRLVSFTCWERADRKTRLQ